MNDLDEGSFTRGRLAAAVLLITSGHLTGCLPPERPLSPEVANRPVQVRVHETAGSAASTGMLVRLGADSVLWTGDGTNAGAHARALTDVSRVEIAQPLTQREAFRRGAIKGGIVGALLGGVLLAVKQDQVAGAIGIAAFGYWLGGVFAGQGAESSQPPVRWIVVHPATAARSGSE